MAGSGHTAGAHSFSLSPGPLHVTVMWSHLQIVLENCGLFILTSAEFKPHPRLLIPLQNDWAGIEFKLNYRRSIQELRGRLGHYTYFLSISTHKLFVHQDRNTHTAKHMQQQVRGVTKTSEVEAVTLKQTLCLTDNQQLHFSSSERNSPYQYIQKRKSPLPPFSIIHSGIIFTPTTLKTFMLMCHCHILLHITC